MNAETLKLYSSVDIHPYAGHRTLLFYIENKLLLFDIGPVYFDINYIYQ
jgi:hypothetical protein